MHRILLQVVFFALVLTENDEGKFNNCSQFINSATLSCCLSREFYKNIHDDSLNECFQFPYSLNSCDRDICIANKLGFASSQGIIDKDGLVKHIQNNFNDDTELKNAIMASCVEEDLNRFGSTDTCELKKLKLCIQLQFISLCNDWDAKEQCAGVQEYIAECIQLYS